MHPEVGQSGSSGSLRLCNLVSVVDWNVIFTTAMNIEEVAKVPGRHGGTFDMPAWETLAPGTVPLHLPLFVFR